MGYKQENGARKDRMWNIATCYCEHYKKWKRNEIDMVLRETIRNIVRGALKMPTLVGEGHNGDLKANGDAAGGHGLHLEGEKQRIDGKNKSVIYVNDKNYKICKDHISGKGHGPRII